MSTDLSFPTFLWLSIKERGVSKKERDIDSLRTFPNNSDPTKVIKHEKHHIAVTKTAPFVGYANLDFKQKTSSSWTLMELTVADIYKKNKNLDNSIVSH